MTLKQRLKKFLKRNSRGDASFTLIELVIVLGILAVLAVVVIIVLNPSEFLKQSRDSNRLSDLQTLNSAIGHYQADGNTSLGASMMDSFYVTNGESGFGLYTCIPDSRTTHALPLNTWKHIVAVVNGSSEKYYDDGVNFYTYSAGSCLALSISRIGQAGASPGGQFNWYPFNGLIDDVRIYNRALSAAEIAAIYNATR
jgi:type II secretory pathway pseudopilin PulG